MVSLPRALVAAWRSATNRVAASKIGASRSTSIGRLIERSAPTAAARRTLSTALPEVTAITTGRRGASASAVSIKASPPGMPTSNTSALPERSSDLSCSVPAAPLAAATTL